MDDSLRERLEATTRWDPAGVEGRVFNAWYESGAFDPPVEGTPEENFSIAIPPPNVTGELHMGHALNGSVQDALIRLNRMRGRNTLWVLGTDHAGIGVQAKVEQMLREQGTSRAGARPRALPGAGLGVARALRGPDRRAVQAPRRLLRLRARAVHPR